MSKAPETNGTLADLLADVYADLGAPSVARRRAAMKRIRNELARQTPRGGLQAMRDPRVSGPIIAALSGDETDAQVIADALHAFRHLARRYFPDLRAREPLCARLGSASRVQRWAAGEALAYLRDERALEALAPLLADRSELVRVTIYRAVAAVAVESTSAVLLDGKRLALKPAAKRRWSERLNAGLADPSRDVRSASAGALAALCGEAALPSLEKALASETDASLREGLQLVIDNTRRALACGGRPPQASTDP